MEILCLWLGVLFAYSQTWALVFVALGVYYFVRRPACVLFFVLGLALVGLHQFWIMPAAPGMDKALNQVQVEGQIVAMQSMSRQKSQFTFKTSMLNGKPCQTLLQLAWYQHPPPMALGQIWQLQVKLKQPRNYRNPGSKDYVQSLAARHVFWTGYVQGRGRLLAQSSAWSLLLFREQLAANLAKVIKDPLSLGVVEALTLGITNHLTQELWTLFRETGTTHLLVISGSHIGLIAGLVFFVSRRFASLFPRLLLRLPAQSLAGIAALLAAFIYALIAGFAPPAQRSVVAAGFFAWRCLGRQFCSIWQIWRYALLLVIVLEPHAVLLPGFYLSFIAVALLFFVWKRWPNQGWRSHVIAQLACLIGLMPFCLFWFGYGSVNGLIANLFAIPLVSFLIVPLSLLILMISQCPGIGPLVWVLQTSIHALVWALQQTARLSWLNVVYALNHSLSLAALVAAFMVLAFFPKLRLRMLACFWMVLAFFPAKLSPPYGEALIRILDVGQGLAVVVHTRQHLLVYDTGDSFYQGGDLGQWVILPYLSQMGVKQIDKLVISHPDRDHQGGLNSIRANRPVLQLIGNQRNKARGMVSCHSYPDWEWDGVRFRFFPIHHRFKAKNNRSCVLQVASSGGKILLAGDIEREAEYYLAQTYGNRLASEVLLVPHHGSKTSSSRAFLARVNPREAIISLGFANRFHFPHLQTLQTYQALEVPLWRTDERGMVSLRLGQATWGLQAKG